VKADHNLIEKGRRADGKLYWLYLADLTADGAVSTQVYCHGGQDKLNTLCRTCRLKVRRITTPGFPKEAKTAMGLMGLLG